MAASLLTQARVLRQYVEERSATTLALNYDFALITLSNGAPDGTTYLNIAAGQVRGSGSRALHWTSRLPARAAFACGCCILTQLDPRPGRPLLPLVPLCHVLCVAVAVRSCGQARV